MSASPGATIDVLAISLAIAGYLLLAASAVAQDTQAAPLPVVQTQFEQIADVCCGTIHGWHTSQLVQYGGSLYALAVTSEREDPNQQKDAGLLFRRDSDGKWVQAARFPYQPLFLIVDPKGRFWILHYNPPTEGSRTSCDVYRSGENGDVSHWERVRRALTTHTGAGISPEGNFLFMSADKERERGEDRVDVAFYDAQSDRWYESHIGPMPVIEHRYAYEAPIIRGRSALVVMRSYNAFGADGGLGHGNDQGRGRYVRLAYCDDLTKGQWKQKLLTGDAWGVAGLADMYATDDGKVHLLYSRRGGATKEEFDAAKTDTYYWAEIGNDLSVKQQVIDMPLRRPKLLVDSASGRWFLVGAQNNELVLMDLDVSGGGFKLSNPRVLANTKDNFTAYVIHTLRPQRFGGQESNERFYLMTTAVKSDTKQFDRVPLNVVSFQIPPK